MPLRASCPGPVLRLVWWMGGCPVPAPPSLALGCRLVGRPVRPGRSGACALCVCVCVCVWGGGGGGGPVAVPPVRLGPGRSGVLEGGGRGVALPQTVPLPPSYGSQCRLRWRRSVHRGCGLHTALVRVCAVLSGRGPRGAPWAALVHRRVSGGQAGGLTGAAARQGHCGNGAAGDGPGARGAWAWWRSATGAAVVPGGRGGGMGLPWPGGGGYKADIP